MAHRPKKKSEFFNKGRSIVTSADDSLFPPVSNTINFENSDESSDLKDHNSLSSSSNGSAVHALNSESIAVTKQYQEKNGPDVNERNASVCKQFKSNCEKSPPGGELTTVQTNNLHNKDSNHLTANSHSESTVTINNGETCLPIQNGSRNGYAHNYSSNLATRDGSHSPDSDEIEIIEEYVNSHYNPCKRKPRPNFYDRHNMRLAKAGYQDRPQRYVGREVIRDNDNVAAHHHSTYPHNSSGYNSHQRYVGPRASSGFNAERSVLYTAIYEEHHASVVNGSYPNRGTSTYKVVSSRYPGESNPYSPEVHGTAPRPSIYPAEINHGRYLDNSTSTSNVQNHPYLTNRASVSNHIPAIRSNALEYSGQTMQSDDSTNYVACVRNAYPMELAPRRPFPSSGIGLNPTVNFPSPPSFKTSYDSFPSRKSAFVPVAQNARTATNVQHQPLEVPLQPNPRPVVGAPSPPSVTSESVASNPPQPEIRPEVPQPPSDKKRFQTCRLCHNHGIIIPIRGHKYVCPYNKCTCSNCKVTLKRRHFVKEQLKITRRQNITMQNGRNSSEPVEPNSVNLQNVQIKPFPQKDVMMKDLALFDDSELFEEIDSICRPQGKGKSS